MQFSSKVLLSKLNETKQETISNKTYHKCFTFEAVPNPDFLKKQEDWRMYDRSYNIQDRNLSIRNHSIIEMQDNKFRFELDFFKVSDISSGGQKQPDMLLVEVKHDCLKFQNVFRLNKNTGKYIKLNHTLSRNVQ